MGSLEIGDLVVNSKGLLTPVLSIHEQGIKPTLKFLFEDGSSTECDSEHLWQVISNKGTIVMTASELLLEYLQSSNPYEANKNEFNYHIPLVKPIKMFQQYSQIGNDDTALFYKYFKSNINVDQTVIIKDKSLVNRLKQIANYSGYLLIVTYNIDDLNYTLVLKSQKTRKLIKVFYTQKKEQCRCISIKSADQLYVTDDYILTHNTSSVNLLNRKILHPFKTTFKATVFDKIATQNLHIAASEYAELTQKNYDEVIADLEEEYDKKGTMIFEFAEATTPAVNS